MRIFIGLREIANITATYAKGFEALGHDTFTILWSRNRFYPNSKYDLVIADHFDASQSNKGYWNTWLTKIKRAVFRLSSFIYSLATCDIYIFTYGSSFLHRYIDYPIIKLFRKKIISVFLGSEIRHWYAYEQEMRYLGMYEDVKPYIEYARNQPGGPLHEKLDIIHAAEKYADLILSLPSMSQLLKRPYMRINIPLDLNQYQFNINNNELPIVVHAPSDRGVKGTNFIMAAVDHLQQEGVEFKFKLIENMSNADVRQLLADSDIVVDQLFSHSVATLALEAMACGNVVLARFTPTYSLIPSDCPVVNVNKDTLVEQLRNILLDRDLRRKLAHEGRRYVEKYHSHLHVVQQILDWLQPGGINEYDFTPTFFQNELNIPPELRQEVSSKSKT